MNRLLCPPTTPKMVKFLSFGVLVAGLNGGEKKVVPESANLPPTVKPFTPYQSSPLPPIPAPAPALPVFKDSPGCPSGMARVQAFCIDRYEIQLMDRTTKEIHPYYKRPPYNMTNLMAVSSAGVFPQGYMSQDMSKLACEAAGKRLCTLSEWQSACSAQPRQGKCNVNKRSPHILDKYFPDIPHIKRNGANFNDPRLLQDPDYLQKSGQCM